MFRARGFVQALVAMRTARPYRGAGYMLDAGWVALKALEAWVQEQSGYQVRLASVVGVPVVCDETIIPNCVELRDSVSGIVVGIANVVDAGEQ